MQTYLATHEDLVGLSGNSLSLSRGACFIIIHFGRRHKTTLGQIWDNFRETLIQLWKFTEFVQIGAFHHDPSWEASLNCEGSVLVCETR